MRHNKGGATQCSYSTGTKSRRRKAPIASRPYRHLLPLNLQMTRDPGHTFENFIIEPKALHGKRLEGNFQASGRANQAGVQRASLDGICYLIPSSLISPLSFAPSIR